jgi:hypothetical protein
VTLASTLGNLTKGDVVDKILLSVLQHTQFAVRLFSCIDRME